MQIDDAFLDEFEADIVRLSRRTYAEVGVPMYLVPEDLTNQTAHHQPNAQGQTLHDTFTAVCAALAARNGALSSQDIAHVLEVLADRHFLDQPFSAVAR
ncbi:hypothetical protein PSQ19_10890 [Devosia algicola]|uniref:Uncharacterized protein n=1 Tax=Devosia algicola TaxID=3026418 RepID=A0ABY7YJH7_9HYPH|nr:hypothetical protein [Devosia algicola]WDR01332.1 hypothetical protein PSQ19_10890 [Devosia algicola]